MAELSCRPPYGAAQGQAPRLPRRKDARGVLQPLPAAQPGFPEAPGAALLLLADTWPHSHIGSRARTAVTLR